MEVARCPRPPSRGNCSRNDRRAPHGL